MGETKNCESCCNSKNCCIKELKKRVESLERWRYWHGA